MCFFYLIDKMSSVSSNNILIIGLIIWIALYGFILYGWCPDNKLNWCALISVIFIIDLMKFSSNMNSVNGDQGLTKESSLNNLPEFTEVNDDIITEEFTETSDEPEKEQKKISDVHNDTETN